MTILYILLALVVLLVMITVHEFGHYCAGKVLGFKINEFAIGFGPTLFKRKKKDGEQFSIRALPLGGFCAFEGEDEDGKDNSEAFNNKPAWKRVIVLLAGVSFNFLFGILTSVIYLLVAGFSVPKVTNIVSQQGVTTYGFKENDTILAVNGKNVEAYRSFTQMTAKYDENEEFVVTVNRDGEVIDIKTKKQKFPAFYFINNDESLQKVLFKLDGDKYVSLTDAEIEELNKTMISASTESETTKETKGTGLAVKSFFENYYYKDGNDYKQLNTNEVFDLLIKGDAEKEIYPVISYATEGVSLGFIQTAVEQDYSFFESVGKAWPFSFYLCDMIIDSLVGLFTGAVDVSEAGGTITAISQVAEISSWGITPFLLLLPLLAMNLAVFNVLPIPALDGARVVFVLIELIFRKPVNRKVEAWIHTIGLFALLALVVFLDINHFVSAFRLLQSFRL
ncbi:MAG: RIP metalloprotease RseP [Clostridia bacterium]|nr:RIP metalloprotease RseP [Clostridia bacterium]